MVDRRKLVEEAKARAQLAKQTAKGRIAQAKHEAREKLQKLKNPPPVYVDLPEEGEDPVENTTEELDAIQDGFRKRAADEGKRFFLATDSEYFACLCFQTREQKETFLTKLNLLQYGDKYLDGQLVAKALGVDLPAADVLYNTSEKVDRKMLEFVPKKSER